MKQSDTVHRVNRRPRLLVLNQYYKPGVEATANLLAELCEALSSDYEVTVVTGRVRDRENLPDDEVFNGYACCVRGQQFSTVQALFDVQSITRRTSSTVVRALALSRPDVVLTLTDPPMIGDVGLIVARRFRVPLVVVSEDVFPEIAIELRRLESPTLIRLLRLMVETYLRRADRIVAIGEAMRGRLVVKGAPPDRIRVIENWVDT